MKVATREALDWGEDNAKQVQGIRIGTARRTIGSWP